MPLNADDAVGCERMLALASVETGFHLLPVLRKENSYIVLSGTE